MSIDKTNDVLTRLGWDDYFAEHFASLGNPGLVPARVEREERNLYQVAYQAGHLTAEVSGRFRNQVEWRSDFPAVGDWVAIEVREDEKKGTIQALLPRRSSFSRKSVLSGGMPDTGGKTDEQVLAANVDTVFLVSGLDGDFNVRRIERYLTVAYNSGATPVIVLNKADLCDNLEAITSEVEAVAVGVDIHPVSAASGEGIDLLNAYMAGGQTVAFLGSSGVGKSTIINTMLGEERLKTREVREGDNRGRHTTTHRELVVLPVGGVVIDTPGMRELQVWGDEDDLARAFDDIESLATRCRFGDCGHVNEPGCAIQAALESGELDGARFSNYIKLQKEIRHLERRKNVRLARQEQRARDKRYRQFHKDMKKVNKKYQ